MIKKQGVVGFLLGGVTALVVSSIQKEDVTSADTVVAPQEEKGKSRQALTVLHGGDTSVSNLEIQQTKEEVKKLYGDKRKEKLTALGDEGLGQLLKSLEADADFMDGMDYSSESLFDDAIQAMA